MNNQRLETLKKACEICGMELDNREVKAKDGRLDADSLEWLLRENYLNQNWDGISPTPKGLDELGELPEFMEKTEDGGYQKKAPMYYIFCTPHRGAQSADGGPAFGHYGHERFYRLADANKFVIEMDSEWWTHEVHDLAEAPAEWAG